MAEAKLRVRSNSKIVQRKLNRIATRIPDALEQDSETVANFFKREIEKWLNRNRNSRGNLGFWKGHLSDTIRVDDIGGGDKGVFIDYTNNGVNVAAWHEYADSGHWVDIDGAPLLRSWMQDKGFETNAMKYLYVEPHPFVKPSAQRASARMREYLRNENSVGELIERELG